MRIFTLGAMLCTAGVLAFTPPGRGDSKSPPPPAVAADPDLIVRPEECIARCRAMGDDYEVCSARVCKPARYPLLRITAFDSDEKTQGDSIEIAGHFGRRGENEFIAFAEERNGRLYHRYQLEITSWDDERIVVRIHPEVDDGLYRLLIVYQMNVGARARPIFIQGSNTVPIDVEPR